MGLYLGYRHEWPGVIVVSIATLAFPAAYLRWVMLRPLRESGEVLVRWTVGTLLGALMLIGFFLLLARQ
jgi:hypothetical protein